MKEVKTICVDCRWHNGASRNATWYEHICKCPAVQPEPYINPVTGKTIQEEKNCRDVNRGNCEHFEYAGSLLSKWLHRNGIINKATGAQEDTK